MFEEAATVALKSDSISDTLEPMAERNKPGAGHMP